GSASQSVIVQAVVTAPNGTATAPVASAAQTVAAGASMSFTVDVPVSNPMFWSPSSPSMYTLTASVRVGNATVDDDAVPFGIRTIKYDPDVGFSINGAATKLKGAG